MRRRDLFSAAAGALVAAALAEGIAFAAVPGAGGVINGCYHKNNGQLRVIDPGTQGCHPSEIPIAWNEQGVKGDKGDEGDPGAPGRDGVDGRDGPSVTVEQEAPGANCAAGGRKITGANGVAYVCNAVPEPQGRCRTGCLTICPVVTTALITELTFTVDQATVVLPLMAPFVDSPDSVCFPNIPGRLVGTFPIGGQVTITETTVPDIVRRRGSFFEIICTDGAICPPHEASDFCFSGCTHTFDEITGAVTVTIGPGENGVIFHQGPFD